MGADILHKSPCCDSEDYSFHGIGQDCPVCKGQEESCENCNTGKLKRDIYFCLLCGSTFLKPAQEVVDYGDEEVNQDA